MVEREEVEHLERHSNPEYVDDESHPEYEFVPNIDWLQRMKDNFIKGDLAFNKVTAQNLVEPLEDDWLICQVTKQHIVREDAVECSVC